MSMVLNFFDPQVRLQEKYYVYSWTLFLFGFLEWNGT